jgi:hypothetical protein
VRENPSSCSVPPGYKKTEVGVIPEDWLVTPPAGLIAIHDGFGFQSQYFEPLGKYVLTTPGHFHETGGFRDIGDKQKLYDGRTDLSVRSPKHNEHLS